jgi:hypothetical protein
MDKKQKTIFSCLGCGCGTLIFIAILFVIIAVASGGGIMNTIYRYTNPEKMTYEGRQVTTLADEQRLPHNEEAAELRTDGSYRNIKQGYALRIKDKIEKNSRETADAEFYLEANPEKTLKFKVKGIGCGLYDIIDDTGQRWGFAAPDRTAEHLNINDHGVILRLTHYRDRKKK